MVSRPTFHTPSLGDEEFDFATIDVNYQWLSPVTTSSYQNEKNDNVTIITMAKTESSSGDMTSVMSNNENNQRGNTKRKCESNRSAEPQKPLPPYALFFRDTQAAIKGQQPNASFEEVSKIVSSMWAALDPGHKNVYKKKAEIARKEYFKALSEYYSRNNNPEDSEEHPHDGNINLPSNNLVNDSNVTYSDFTFSQNQPLTQIPDISLLVNSNQQQQIPQPVTAMMSSNDTSSGISLNNMPIDHPNSMQIPSSGELAMPLEQQYNSNNEFQQSCMFNTQSGPMDQSSYNLNQNNNVTSNPMGMVTGGAGTGTSDSEMPNGPPVSPNENLQKCIRDGCANTAIINPDWEDEYCSNECVVIHCRNVFTQWVQANTQVEELAGVI